MVNFHKKIIVLILISTAIQFSFTQNNKQNLDDPNFSLKSTTTQQNSAKTNACATSDNHATPYNSNNGQRGCMFDVTATNSVTVQCFDANCMLEPQLIMKFITKQEHMLALKIMQLHGH